MASSGNARGLQPACWPVALRWLALAVMSVIFAGAMTFFHLSAAFLLGPMIAAIIMATAGGTVKIAKPVFIAAQGIVGVMISSNLPPSLLHEIAGDWPVFLAGTASTLIAAGILGWLITRSGALPGTTAIWGSSPGAATIMTLMSESYGADMRLVAFMQYLRVVACALAATILAGILGVPASDKGIEWIPSLHTWYSSIGALVLAFGGAWAGHRFKVPGGPLLLTMIIGMAAKLSGAFNLVLPEPVLIISYALIGLGIGLRFTPEVIRHAAKVFPRVALSIIALLAASAVFAAALVVFAGIDPLTAYLATSPGGADSVAIIAAGTKVDLPFIMAMQVARLLLVLITGPALARFLSRGHETLSANNQGNAGD